MSHDPSHTFNHNTLAKQIEKRKTKRENVCLVFVFMFLRQRFLWGRLMESDLQDLKAETPDVQTSKCPNIQLPMARWMETRGEELCLPGQKRKEEYEE